MKFIHLYTNKICLEFLLHHKFGKRELVQINCKTTLVLLLMWKLHSCHSHYLIPSRDAMLYTSRNQSLNYSGCRITRHLTDAIVLIMAVIPKVSTMEDYVQSASHDTTVFLNTWPDLVWKCVPTSSPWLLMTNIILSRVSDIRVFRVSSSGASRVLRSRGSR